jgi:hypothetical protein
MLIHYKVTCMKITCISISLQAKFEMIYYQNIYAWPFFIKITYFDNIVHLRTTLMKRLKVILEKHDWFSSSG